MNGRFREQRRIAYALKRIHGQPVDIFRATPVADPVGRVTQNLQTWHVEKAAILPAKESRKFSNMLHGIENRQVVLGGYYDNDMKDVLISLRDLPYGFEFDQSDYLTIDKKRYQIAAPNGIKTFEHREFVIITAKADLAQPYAGAIGLAADAISLSDAANASNLTQIATDTISFDDGAK